MKLSIIIPILNSHEIVRRQALYFSKMNLPSDVEFIFVDDGSNPALNVEDYQLRNLTILATNDFRKWTQGLARNAGARIAKGEYLLMTDIDHIISREAIEDAKNFTGDRMIFKRYFGVLLEDGTLTQDLDVLEAYGMDRARASTKRGLYASVHGNTFAIKRSTFELLRGYDPKHCLYGHHAAAGKGEDSVFNKVWNRYASQNNIKIEVGSDIYMFPISRYHSKGETNPLGLFHGLNYE